MIIQCTREVADIQRRSTVNLWRWCACVSSGARPFPRSGPWIPGRVKVSRCFPRSTGVQAVYTCCNQCAGYLPQPVQATCRARCYKRSLWLCQQCYLHFCALTMHLSASRACIYEFRRGFCTLVLFIVLVGECTALWASQQHANLPAVVRRTAAYIAMHECVEGSAIHLRVCMTRRTCT